MRADKSMQGWIKAGVSVSAIRGTQDGLSSAFDGPEPPGYERCGCDLPSRPGAKALELMGR